MSARVDLWLSVVPDPIQYADLAHVAPLRTAALMRMLDHHVVLSAATSPDQRGGWEKNQIAVIGGEAAQQLIYQLVHEKCMRYAGERSRNSAVAPDDWSRNGVRLRIQSSGATADKQGQYYYNDSLTRWCRYRLRLVRSDNGQPWTLMEQVDGKTLSATVEASLAVEMV